MDGITRRSIGWAAAVFCLCAAPLSAEQPWAGAGQIVVPPHEQPPVGPAVPFRDGPYGDHTHLGDPQAPSVGYPHYDLETKHYDHWYLPKLFGWGKAERCSPRPFRPRGYGNLSNPPSTCYRIDYNPYVLEDARTRWGPSYFMRQPDPRCDCGHCEQCCAKSHFRARNEEACRRVVGYDQ